VTTLLIIFIVSVLLSLLLTPIAGRLGERFGAMDVPDERKVHKCPTPRTGGIAIFISFFVTLVACRMLGTDVSRLLVFDTYAVAFTIGACIIFAVGLWDDFVWLNPRLKLLFQVLAATVAFAGGLEVKSFHAFGFSLHFGYFSYFVTVFWFLLLINAVNLVDGLDGLAGGIVMFASMVMVAMGVMKGNFMHAALFLALAGSILGFLRYNFAPAKIFLGDGGSYFLGYAVAGLAVMGSAKTPVGVALLLPLISLGIPVFDTILSPVRRFLLGRRIFQPDKSHFHHQLLKMGLTRRKAVLFIYAITIALCLIAVVTINLRDEQAGLLLVVLGIAVFFLIQKANYFNYFTPGKIYGWITDIIDEVGFSSTRRSFLNIQIRAAHASNLNELWKEIVRAANQLGFDQCTLYLVNGVCDSEHSEERRLEKLEARNAFEKAWPADILKNLRASPPARIWKRPEMRNKNFKVFDAGLFRLQLPLFDPANGEHFATLMLTKDVHREPISRYTLGRIEHFRHSLDPAIAHIVQGEKDKHENEQ
jgi:UDP-GlcNAc:undecaprenyl-phosphate/decaprenyl-phosphate GlcNAc-1-phosphate transferase